MKHCSTQAAQHGAATAALPSMQYKHCSMQYTKQLQLAIHSPQHTCYSGTECSTCAAEHERQYTNHTTWTAVNRLRYRSTRDAVRSEHRNAAVSPVVAWTSLARCGTADCTTNSQKHLHATLHNECAHTSCCTSCCCCCRWLLLDLWRPSHLGTRPSTNRPGTTACSTHVPHNEMPMGSTDTRTAGAHARDQYWRMYTHSSHTHAGARGLRIDPHPGHLSTKPGKKQAF